MRHMSFSLTTRQFLNGSKTVTRRLGWAYLKPGDRLQAVEKNQGLKRGEKIKRLGAIEIVNVRRERIDQVTGPDVLLEGFPDLSPQEFLVFFCKSMRCGPATRVTRIEFRRLS